jgi:hypothetical protein
MTFDELKAKFDEAWPKYWKVKDYEKFDDIPKKLRVPESLFVWVYDAPAMLKEIPLAFVDDDIRFAGVQNYGDVIEFISKDDTDRYEEIALCAVRSHPASFNKIDPCVFSDHFFVEAIKSRCDVVFHIRKALDNGYKLTSEIVGAAVEHSISAISSLMGAEGFAELVTDEMVRRGVSTSFVDEYAWWIDMGSLERLGKTSVVKDVISSGFWPITFRSDFDDAYFPDVVRPASLADAIDKYRTEIRTNGNLPELFKFAVLSYAHDDVIAALESTSEGLDTLQTLYTEKELAPHIKKYKGLKGRFLEDTLGM